jgi:hypothetical protein
MEPGSNEHRSRVLITVSRMGEYQVEAFWLVVPKVRGSTASQVIWWALFRVFSAERSDLESLLKIR